MACGTFSSDRVRSELRFRKLRTASGSLRTLGESTLTPRSLNATDFSSFAHRGVFRADHGVSAQRFALYRRATPSSPIEKTERPSIFRMLAGRGDANMLHAFENKHQLPNGAARGEVGVAPESPSLAAVSDRQRQRETEAIMEALVRQYLACNYQAGAVSSRTVMVR
jgi:hypothetical protein